MITLNVWSFPGQLQEKYCHARLLPERDSVRTAMQWSGEKHGGFSAYASQTPIPILSEGPYGYPKVNVHTQMRDPLSLLNWMERIISGRMDTDGSG